MVTIMMACQREKCGNETQYGKLYKYGHLAYKLSVVRCQLFVSATLRRNYNIPT